MSRWIALHCGDEAEALQAQHPSAFLLLCQIARRAKWKDCRITKMKKGEALIGDWKEAGIHSEMAYRIAKTTLADCGLATFQGTNKGTRATLASTTVFSLSSPLNNDPENEQGNDPTTNRERSNNERGTNEERTSNDPTTTNHTDTRDTQTTLIQSEKNTLFSELENMPAKSPRKAKTEANTQAEAIYQAYPRKEKKPDALTAIHKAMSKHAPDFLLERTHAYATAIAWQERHYIPHPATWFNAEQFNDDPEAWKSPPPKSLKSKFAGIQEFIQLPT